ncbi:MAG: tRNA pseudouridine(55) synthase TruB [Steroidobacteraceae bacterium]
MTAAASGTGLVLLDKPLGLSSNTAMQKVRHLYGRVKAGHTGSLDPLASGMLPICLGEATKLAGELLSQRKAYRFTLALGAATATGDAEGEVSERQPVPPFDAAQLYAVLQQFRGPQQQVPPMYSALKRDGRPLYELARRGEVVAREARAIEILRLEPLAVSPDQIELEVHCSKGTYVRVLGEDLARALGTVGHLAALRRLWVEPFEALPMWTLEQLESPQARVEALLPADRAVPQLPEVRLDAAAAAALRQGRALPWRPQVPRNAAGLRLYDECDEFMGLGQSDAAGVLRVRRLFVSARPT